MIKAADWILLLVVTGLNLGMTLLLLVHILEIKALIKEVWS